MTEDETRDRVNSIMQLVNLELQAESRRTGRAVDPREKIRRMQERIEAVGLPLPEHLRKPGGA